MHILNYFITDLQLTEGHTKLNGLARHWIEIFGKERDTCRQMSEFLYKIFKSSERRESTWVWRLQRIQGEGDISDGLRGKMTLESTESHVWQQLQPWFVEQQIPECLFQYHCLGLLGLISDPRIAQVKIIPDEHSSLGEMPGAGPSDEVFKI